MHTISCAKTEKSKEELRKSFGIKETDNPLFNLSMDLFRYMYTFCNNLYMYN